MQTQRESRSLSKQSYKTKSLTPPPQAWLEGVLLVYSRPSLFNQDIFYSAKTIHEVYLPSLSLALHLYSVCTLVHSCKLWAKANPLNCLNEEGLYQQIAICLNKPIFDFDKENSDNTIFILLDYNKTYLSVP